MMELRHIAMVNWHLFDVEDIEVRGHIGVLGENRSGKSTILDMAQVVLTGGNRNILILNAVAGDKGRRRGGSKRTVVDYCLGALGEDQRQRDEARTYIALGFEDTYGDRPPVTIGMAIEARKSESTETVLGRFVAVGKIFKAEDFIEVHDQARFPAQWDEVRSRIVAAVGEQGFVNHRDKAVDYVREYMRHLLPHASFVGQQNATSLQKAVVNAMTLDHDQTATEFVREYILEKNNMRVGELRESIQTYRNINEIIRKMRERLEALKALRGILDQLHEAYELKHREDWIAKRAEWLTSRATNRDFKGKLLLECARRDAANKEVSLLREDVLAIEAEIDRLTSAIAEHDAKTGRPALQQEAKTAGQAAGRAAADFEKRMSYIRFLQPLCAMHGLGFDDCVPAIEALVRLTKDARIERLPGETDRAEGALAAIMPSMLAQVDAARKKLIHETEDQRKRLDNMRTRLQQHESGQANAHLSENTEALCRKLRHSGLTPRVLCDLLEVADREWTAAAEGLLGRDREAVFVDRTDIANATVIFKEGRRDFRGASLVSLNKLESHRAPPQRGTFPSIFRSEDQDAMSFIMRRYGSVRLANTLGEFNATGRAIMKDGLYDDGLVRTHRARDASDYKIGKSAQARALRDLREQADALDEEAAKTGRIASAVDTAYSALKALFEDPNLTSSALAAAYAAAIEQQNDANRRIAALDGAGDGGLRDKRKVQLALKRTREDERNMQQKAFYKHDAEANSLSRRLADREDVPGSTLHLSYAWSGFLKNLRFYDRIKGRAAHRARLDASTRKNDVERHRDVAMKATVAAAQADVDRVEIERRAREALVAYFDSNAVSSEIGIESPLLAEVKPWAIQLIDEIESNELRRYERQAREAADKAATLLRGEFINALTSRIAKMERELQAMNRSLHEHPFHNERYSFHYARVVEFQAILKITEISKTSPEALDMLFRDEVPDDFPYKDTISELKALLEDPNKDFTQFEDYRKFYTFEIHMEDIVTGRTTRWETRRGTGSGAEQQVPIYVAIGASLASVYGSAERRPGQPAGFALAIFDEAFSKLDGKNQRQMMTFYKKLGLQIVIAAPYEKRVTILEHMNTIAEIDRIGERARATVVQLKERARQELTAMDPEQISDDTLAARVAAE